MSDKWVTTADGAVRHVWVCGVDGCEDKGKEITIPPTFYADAGTPICGEDGHDMCYVRTEIRLHCVRRSGAGRPRQTQYRESPIT